MDQHYNVCGVQTDKMNLIEMKCLNSMAGMTIRDRIREEIIRRTSGKLIACRIDMSVLRWFVYKEKNLCKLSDKESDEYLYG